MPIILVTQEAKIRRITVQSQPGKIVREKIPITKRTDGVAQNEDPESKPQYQKKKKKSLFSS
jgi:hypothetical protein